MALKNRKSKGKNTFEKIQNSLAQNGAKKVMFDYGNDGKMESITFAIEINQQLVGFRLPALVENVTQILYGGKDRWGNTKKVTDAQRLQAYNTAWANIRDWIDSQLALVATRQVALVQVFLPYMVTKNDQTLYESFINNPNNLLGSGK